VVVGLLGSSALVIVLKWWPIKILVLLGLLILFSVEHQGITKQLSTFPAFIQTLDNVALWHSLGVIGAVIYLLGAECNCEKSKQTAGSESSTKAT